MVPCAKKDCRGACPTFMVRNGYDKPGWERMRCLECGATFAKPNPKIGGGGGAGTANQDQRSLRDQLAALQKENQRLKTSTSVSGGSASDGSAAAEPRVSADDVEKQIKGLTDMGLYTGDVEKQLSAKLLELRATESTNSATTTLEKARQQAQRLEKDTKKQVEKVDRLKQQLAEAEERLGSLALDLAVAQREEAKVLQRELDAKRKDSQPVQRKAISIDLETLIGTEDAPIDINFGSLLDGLDGVALSPEEEAEKDKMCETFGKDAGQAARKQFEPVVRYLRQMAEQRRAFTQRVAKRQRQQGDTGQPAAEVEVKKESVVEITATPPSSTSSAPTPAATRIAKATPEEKREAEKIVEDIRAAAKSSGAAK